MLHGAARPDNRPAQRMAAPEILREHLVGHRFGVVVLHADFLEDDLLLLGDVLGREQGMQHHVGEHVEGQRQILIEHARTKAGGFLGREGVEHAADRVYFARDLLGRAPLGALEHHVLDEVRDSVQRRRFLARARAHPDAHRHRARMRHRLGHQHQAVRQLFPHNRWSNVFHRLSFSDDCTRASETPRFTGPLGTLAIRGGRHTAVILSPPWRTKNLSFSLCRLASRVPVVSQFETTLLGRTADPSLRSASG